MSVGTTALPITAAMVRAINAHRKRALQSTRALSSVTFSNVAGSAVRDRNPPIREFFQKKPLHSLRSRYLLW